MNLCKHHPAPQALPPLCLGALAMVSHRDRLKSIHTPPRRDKVSPSKRERREDEGPTPFALQRQAETIGARTVCALDGRGTITFAKDIDGKSVIAKGWQSEAEFASSSSLARIFNEARITSQQYRAGTNYARLYRLIWGRAVPRESSLTKVMATPMEDRIAQANAAAREERDDEDYADWIAERRAELEQGEHALRNIQIDVPARLKLSKNFKGNLKKARQNTAHAIIIKARADIRMVVRRVCIEGVYIHRQQLIDNLRTGLEALRYEWGIK